MTRNSNFVPTIIQNLGESVVDPRKPESERGNYVVRLEAIRDYCTEVLEKYERTKSLSKGTKIKRQ